MAKAFEEEKEADIKEKENRRLGKSTAMLPSSRSTNYSLKKQSSSSPKTLQVRPSLIKYREELKEREGKYKQEPCYQRR